jgi:hypothetical protein
LTASQIGLIGLDFVKTPANFRDFCAAIPRCWSSSTGLSAIVGGLQPLSCKNRRRSYDMWYRCASDSTLVIYKTK